MKLITIFFLSSIFFVQTGTGSPPEAEKGILNLHNWNFREKGPVKLKGEWNFFPRRDMQRNEEDDSAVLKTYFKMPGLWNGYTYKDTVMGSDGHGTFSLKVILPPESKNLALKLGEIKSAYRLSVNKKTVFHAGVPGDSRRAEIPRWKPALVPLKTSAPSLDILLYISNHHYYKGGPHRCPVLGPEKILQRNLEIRRIAEIFLFGSLIIMSLYHFVLYLSRRREKSPVYFAFYCLFISIYLITTGEIFIYSLFPRISWNILVTSIYLSLYICVPLFLYYLRCLFPEAVHRKAIYFFTFISSLFIALVIFTPVFVFSRSLPFFHVYLFIVSIYVLYVIISAIMKGLFGAKVLLAGIGAFLLTILNDILYHEEIIHTFDATPAGVFFLILCQAYISSRQPRNKEHGNKKKLLLSKEKQRQMKRVIQYIENHFQEDISREGLASLAGLHPDNFGRFFKQYTGQKTGDFINRLRIEEAKKILIERDETILEIAMSVGFENLRTFNRIFRQMEGTSPGEFRKGHKKKE